MKRSAKWPDEAPIFRATWSGIDRCRSIYEGTDIEGSFLVIRYPWRGGSLNHDTNDKNNRLIPLTPLARQMLAIARSGK